jgi:glycosyltransferase involved in cell wall biosynthesis
MRLKILFLSHYFYPSIGGIETISEILSKNFVDAGHEVRLVTWSEDSNAKQFPFSVVRKPNRRQLLKEHAWADIVFENNPCLRLSWPGALFRRPSIVVLQTWLAEVNSKANLSTSLKTWWLKRAGKVVAISDAVRQRCFPEATIIGNSYNVNNFRIYPDITRNKDFVFVGRLVSDKGAVLAVRALHLLFTRKSGDSQPTKNYSLTIVGEGPERGNLENLVAELQLGDYVDFVGPLSGKELAICLNRHKYILVPSVWEEPFGIVALEGLACGCLPIVSDGGGLPDAVGRAGITFKRGDVNDLENTINKLINDPLMQQQFRDA